MLNTLVISRNFMTFLTEINDLVHGENQYELEEAYSVRVYYVWDR